MADGDLVLLFLYKAKYRRKVTGVMLPWNLVACICIFCGFVAAQDCGDSGCVTSACASDNCALPHVLDIDPNLYWSPLAEQPVEFSVASPSVAGRCSRRQRLNGKEGLFSDGPGNYSINMRCTWLLEAQPNSSLRLHLDSFATECTWDHLYVYDGDSVRAPLLAVYSGITVQPGYKVRQVPEVRGTSGSMLVHFYSDHAYNMSGFNITYKENGCPSTSSLAPCSDHGVCFEGACTCDAGFHGDACHLVVCPRDCSGHGACDGEQHICRCQEGYAGVDCSQVVDLGYWEALQPTSGLIPTQIARTSAAGGVGPTGDELWVVGGEFFTNASETEPVIAYNVTGNSWRSVWTKGSSDSTIPSHRYGHSVVVLEGVLYMFGGMKKNGKATEELWALNMETQIWERLTAQKSICMLKVCGPLASVGHSATLVKDKMIVIFGHSPVYGYMNFVQEYNIVSGEWSVVTASGATVKGGYGHTAVWDPISKKIYVFGGYVSENIASYALTDRLYSYDPSARQWRVLVPSGSPRYLHTAVMSSGLMLVFGGNTHNETAASQGAKCYSGDLLAYDVLCDAWYRLDFPSQSLLAQGVDAPRYGHLAAVFPSPAETYPQMMVFFGGFDGQPKGDLLKYVPGSCETLARKEQCLGALPGRKCVWSEHKCKPLTSSSSKEGVDECNQVSILDGNNEGAWPVPLSRTLNSSILCASLLSRSSCEQMQPTFDCVWCGHSCQHSKCKNLVKGSAAYMQTDLEASVCRTLHSCIACHTASQCRWSLENSSCVPILSVTSTNDVDREDATCDVPCFERTSCGNCTSSRCLWCRSEQRCLEKNAYIPTFPYGQCREWVTVKDKCKEDVHGVSGCNAYQSCSDCLGDPACGWCDDGSQSGTGRCMSGGNKGDWEAICPAPFWYFTACPSCQCNGHSHCRTTEGICDECEHNTEGAHCEYCKQGFFGNPLNGGNCSVCECNGHGSLCNRETGRCNCNVKGVVGDRCESCDVANKYYGDPTNGGSCYYILAIDFQFTFNMSKREDRHYTQIHFRNVPTKPDLDADFSIMCSSEAKLNISVKTETRPERWLLLNHSFMNFKSRFTKAEYSFGSEENTTFFIYVYDFTTPIWVQVSFSQHPKLDLLQFFITFSTCFLTLLIIAAVLWKIKQKYDLYRRRQRLFVEMEQMASRPFAQIWLEIQPAVPSLQTPTPKTTPTSESCTSFPNATLQAPPTSLPVPTSSSPNGGVKVSQRELLETYVWWPNCLEDGSGSSFGEDGVKKYTTAIRRRRKNRPSPIALEPCVDNRAAVLSLLVRLPTGGSQFTPPGQVGLAVASALVTLGNPRKTSTPLDPSKGDKPKVRKHLAGQNLDSCI